ncbi:MAG: DNA-formamidopyrimidine glycosylase family protein [Planctomycetota bacterium]
MPEGDTLYRIANRLRPVLAGQTIVDAQANPPRTGAMIDAESLVGNRVELVEATGKHLLITFDDRQVLHSHLGMTGSWHLYAPDQRWRKPRHRAGVVLKTETHTAVNFSPKFLELVTEHTIARNAYLRRLGPDMMLTETDVAEVIPRMRRCGQLPIGEAVMNQTLVAGIGNIYKSESLFLAKLNPWVTVNEIDDKQLLAYLKLTKCLMRRNRHGGERRTRFSPDGPLLWVYGRSGERCLVCGEFIQIRRQGDQGRTTFWCGECQATKIATDN